MTVVEAAEYSGSLITVRLGLEYGREIFAVPGNITSPNSFGPHVLIRDGAKLVSSWQGVVEELPHPIRVKILAPLVAKIKAVPELQLDGAEAEVWKMLSVQEAVSIDALLAKLPLPTSEVYSALLGLELNEYVRQLPGKNTLDGSDKNVLLIFPRSRLIR